MNIKRTRYREREKIIDFQYIFNIFVSSTQINKFSNIISQINIYFKKSR